MTNDYKLWRINKIKLLSIAAQSPVGPTKLETGPISLGTLGCQIVLWAQIVQD